MSDSSASIIAAAARYPSMDEAPFAIMAAVINPPIDIPEGIIEPLIAANFPAGSRAASVPNK